MLITDPIKIINIFMVDSKFSCLALYITEINGKSVVIYPSIKFSQFLGQNTIHFHSVDPVVHPPPLSAGPCQYLTFKRVCDFFQEKGAVFFIKNKLKPDMFNDKKLYKTKMFFSATTKNLNWETLT